MSKKGNQRKNEQLGMNYGTASHKLKKSMMFYMAQELGMDTCFQCEKTIQTLEEFSVEHKVPWLDSEDPLAFFFAIENIAFSHLGCNAGAARQPRKKYTTPEERRLSRNTTARERYSKKIKEERIATRRRKYTMHGC